MTLTIRYLFYDLSVDSFEIHIDHLLKHPKTKQKKKTFKTKDRTIDSLFLSLSVSDIWNVLCIFNKEKVIVNVINAQTRIQTYSIASYLITLFKKEKKNPRIIKTKKKRHSQLRRYTVCNILLFILNDCWLWFGMVLRLLSSVYLLFTSMTNGSLLKYFFFYFVQIDRLKSP